MSRVTVVNIHDVKSLGETHTDGIPVQFIMLFDFDISAWMLQFYVYRVN